jgi:glyoxylase-like metal-dependent hydrolase (beta-lactamase superfamily II)
MYVHCQAGLTAEDIDVVVTSHGHPDHRGNDNLFVDAQRYFNGNLNIGNRFGFVYK